MQDGCITDECRANQRPGRHCGRGVGAGIGRNEDETKREKQPAQVKMKHLCRQEVALPEPDEKLEGQPDQIGLQNIDRQANEDWSKRKLRREDQINENSCQCRGAKQDDW